MLKTQCSPEEFWASSYGILTLISKISKKKNEKQAIKNYKENLLDEKNSCAVNTKIFSSMIASETFKPFMVEIFSHAYKYNFHKESSYNPAFENIKIRNEDRRKKVNLLKHSLGVTNEMYKLSYGKFGLLADLFILLALIHDYGKSTTLKEDCEISLSIAHHEASSQYLKRLIIKNETISDYYKNLLSKIAQVLSAHHSPDVESLFYATSKSDEHKELELLLLSHLKRADRAQIEKEDSESDL